MAHRVDLPHFSNHTNNRVESLFGKLKLTLRAKLTMKASLVAVLEYQRRVERDYQSRVEMPGTSRDVAFPEEMDVVLGMTTRWVADAIMSQYDVIMDSSLSDSYAFRDNGATVIVRRTEREFLREKESWKCDFEFSQTMQLPCRHAMIFRKTCGLPFVFPYAAIANRQVHLLTRWFGRSHSSPVNLPEIPEPLLVKTYKVKMSAASATTGLSESEKYRRAQQVFARIGGELARLEDVEFGTALQKLDQWWYSLRQGAQAAAEQGDDSGVVCGDSKDDQLEGSDTGKRPNRLADNPVREP